MSQTSIKNYFVKKGKSSLTKWIYYEVIQWPMVKWINTIKIKRNQQAILRLASTSDHIILIPKKNVSHYYHFVFDLLLPLSLLIEKAPGTTIFVLKNIGILSPILTEVWGSRVLIVEELEEFPNAPKSKILGIEPRGNNINHFNFKFLNQRIHKRLQIQIEDKPNKILLIERLPPDPYYLHPGRRRSAGSTRRSIINHLELSQYIESIIPSGYEFHNLALEQIPFADQIRLFNSAVMVIAQHGAGLSNIFWMNEKSIVVELGLGKNPGTHYKHLSKSLKHLYLPFKDKKNHIEVNFKELHNGLFRNKVTNEFFNLKNQNR